MKNFFKITLLSFVLLLTVFQVNSQTVAGGTMATANSVTNLNTAFSIPTSGVFVTKISIAVPTAATSNATFFFYDWWASRQTNLWFTNIVSFTNATIVDPFTNNVIFTNSLGQVQTNQYIGKGVFYTNVTAANTTGSVPAIGAITVSPGTTYTLDVNWPLAQGLAVRGTNNNPLSFIIVEYH